VPSHLAQLEGDSAQRASSGCTPRAFFWKVLVFFKNRAQPLTAHDASLCHYAMPERTYRPSSQARSPVSTNPDHPGGRSPQSDCSVRSHSHCSISLLKSKFKIFWGIWAPPRQPTSKCPHLPLPYGHRGPHSASPPLTCPECPLATFVS
jgi:hypothetical protein